MQLEESQNFFIIEYRLFVNQSIIKKCHIQQQTQKIILALNQVWIKQFKLQLRFPDFCINNETKIKLYSSYNIITMKYNSYIKDLVKKFNRSSSKEQTKPYLSTSKHKTRLLTEQSPTRYNTEKRDPYRSLNKGKSISKTPKNSNNTLIDSIMETKIRQRPRSHLKITNLDHSLSPKRLEGAFAAVQKSFHSSKAAQKQFNFNREGDTREKQYKSKREDIKPISPISKQVRKRTGFADFYNCQNDLTEQQYKNFGDRFPSSFMKVGLLGRGGFSLVWLGIQKKSKRRVAVKQILSKNPHQTHLKQIWFGNYFFNQGGEPRQQFKTHPGINNICGLLTYEIEPLDTWLYYELCEDSLGSSLYQLKGHTVAKQRKYLIQHKELQIRFRQNLDQLKFLIVEVSKALLLLSSHNIVHSDLKTQNIMLKLRKKPLPGELLLKEVKIIDFGSSFLFTNLKQFSMATPQYMPPEILNYILFQNGLDYDPAQLKLIQKYKKPWVVDIWSLGCIILQIVCGIPLWMSLDTKVSSHNKQMFATGLFAVKGRVFPDIIRKQIQTVNQLDYHLQFSNFSGIRLSKDIKNVLKGMLDLNPERRISPRDVLQAFNVKCDPDKIPFY